MSITALVERLVRVRRAVHSLNSPPIAAEHRPAFNICSGCTGIQSKKCFSKKLHTATFSAVRMFGKARLAAGQKRTSYLFLQVDLARVRELSQ